MLIVPRQEIACDGVFSVTQRHHEIDVRIAMGAWAIEVLDLVVKEGLPNGAAGGSAAACRTGIDIVLCVGTQVAAPGVGIMSQRPVSIILRLYRTVANAFPYEFKNSYQDELMLVTEDAIEPIWRLWWLWRRHGVLGLARLVLNIAFSIPAEHLAGRGNNCNSRAKMLHTRFMAER